MTKLFRQKKLLRQCTIPSLLIVLCSLIFRHSQAQQLNAFMRNCAFHSVSADTSYIETYIAVPGFELHYVKNANGKFEGALDVVLDYLHDSVTVISDHYTLRTPEISDTSNISFNVLDLRRELIGEGNYNITMRITDVNHSSSEAILTGEVPVNFTKTQVAISDIEFVQEYTATTTKNLYSKNGYDIHPLAISFFPNTLNKLTFYSEIYNARSPTSDDDIILMYSIKNAQSGSVVNDLFRFSRQKASAINFLFSDLPTGNYVVQVQVKNKKNELLAQQAAYFQRINKNSVSELSSIGLIDISNKFVRTMPGDSMKYYLSCLLPKAEPYEHDYILQTIAKKDTLLMKQFFYNFWQQRNNAEPLKEWMAYSKMVDVVNYNYSTPVQHGFETDRGRVYLQYGPPDQLDGRDHEPNAYPYEIWQYYKISTGQSNVRFVFCNSDLVSNDYKLIHSDARGELNDLRWKFKIYKTFRDSNGYSNPDIENYPSTYGSQVDDLFTR